MDSNQKLAQQDRANSRNQRVDKATIRSVTVPPKSHIDCARRLILLIVFSTTLVATHCAVLARESNAADLTKAKAAFATGEYLECLAECTEAVEAGIWNEEWYRLKIDVEMTLGKYEDAMRTMELGFEKYATSIHLRWRGYHILRMNNMPEEAGNMLASIDPTVRQYPWRFSDASNRVVVGRFEIEIGSDAREVLTTHYDKAKDLSPRNVRAYQASAELALAKHDYALASKELQAAITFDEENATLHYLLAKAFASSDPEKSQTELDRALELNPNHVDSLLWSADMAIDGERFDDAEALLNHVESINPALPEVWCYRAVLAHLDGDFELEQRHRQKALEPFNTNPKVDHLIGRKLAMKYRFRESAEHQRKALEFDPDFVPAMFQLSQDLLRLGEDEEGWQLAREVNRLDGYNVVAHNLMTLRELLSNFATIERNGIILRMSSLEADLYGERAMQLLSRAKDVLGEKYDTEIDKPVIVEIFPEQKDFAIRTFGLPGGQGFLGVCFGRVITANSPASQGTHPSNWEATLWHEFCHAITLEKTNNRMPRWLSEGISVYEERLEGPGWGQTMNAQYRSMIIDGKLVPVDRLSDAFLHASTPMDLQFAYYQSSLVVEFLVDTHGIEVLKNVLTDLGVGMPINDSLARYVGSLEVFNRDFESYARGLAGDLAADGDWSEANLPRDASVLEIMAWLDGHPNHIAALRMLAERNVAGEDWESAVDTLERLLTIYGDSMDNARDYVMLSMAYRELGQLDDERRVLERLVAHVADAGDAHQRLLEIAQEEEDWSLAYDQAQRLLSIDPLVPMPHLASAQAAGQLDRPEDALVAYRALLRFRSSDVAECHYRMARLSAQLEDWRSANRSILLAIEEAPRYREAYALYRQIKTQLADLPDEEDSATEPSTDGIGGVEAVNK